MAVVAAGELEHAVARRECAGKPHCAHRRLGAGRHEPHLLDRRHGGDDLGRELDLGLGRRTERRAELGGGANGVDRGRVGVAEEQRPPRHDPVDVAVAVDVLEVGALAAPDEERLVDADAAHRADRRVHPAGDQVEGAAVQLTARPQSQVASSFVQYETTKSAPARLIAVSDSSAA